jgi:hypothetical protein
MPYNIYLSQDPFNDHIELLVTDFGSHDTMGMVLHQCPHWNRPQLVDILPGNPMSRIKRWRSTIKKAYCTQIEEYVITTISDVREAIATARASKLTQLQVEFSIDDNIPGLHPKEGLTTNVL